MPISWLSCAALVPAAHDAAHGAGADGFGDFQAFDGDLFGRFAFVLPGLGDGADAADAGIDFEAELVGVGFDGGQRVFGPAHHGHDGQGGKFDIGLGVPSRCA